MNRSRQSKDTKRIDLTLPIAVAEAVEDYRASKRPIPSENEALRWLIESALVNEGFMK